MKSAIRGSRPDVWAHKGRYFATAQIRLSGGDATAFICVSRWSPRNDWQLVRVELREIGLSKLNKATGQEQRVVRRPKAELPKPRMVTMGWFPDERELSKLRPISIATLGALGLELRAIVRTHVLSYSLAESLDEQEPELCVALTARRYRQLVEIGETSPALSIAESLQIPVRTVHNRLRLARERGLLPSAGRGARRTTTTTPRSKRDRDLLYDIVGPSITKSHANPPKKPSGAARSVAPAKARGRVKF